MITTELKQCTGKISCGQFKPLSKFKLYDSGTYSGQCLDCTQKYHIEYNKKWENEHYEERKINKKQYREDHKEEIKINKKQYYENNKKHILLRRKQRYAANKEYILQQTSQYQKEHKKERRLREKNRRETDIEFRLRKTISASIYYALKINGGSKNGCSILDCLPYTIPELHTYIETQFSIPKNLTNDGKVWMTWENQGIYNPKIWDDSNPSTWVWQLDHIIPQSDLPFKSMEEENFKKCWSLANLRPLSAKINHSDGVTRIRHVFINHYNNETLND